jgi:hypothetical protein
MVTWWRVRKRCTVAALAEAHKMMNRPKAKTDRIEFALSRTGYQPDHVRTGDHGPKL